MTRGKQGNAANHRRMVDAEEHVAALKKALGRERREHEISKRIAAEADALRDRCKTLEQDLDLATNDEMRELYERLGAHRDQMRAVVMLWAEQIEGIEKRRRERKFLAADAETSARFRVRIKRAIPQQEQFDQVMAVIAEYEAGFELGSDPELFSRLRALLGVELFEEWLSHGGSPTRRDRRRARRKMRRNDPKLVLDRGRTPVEIVAKEERIPVPLAEALAELPGTVETILAELEEEQK